MEKTELNFIQNTGLNFCKTLDFWTVFYRKNHCALSEKRDKKTRHNYLGLHLFMKVSKLLKLFLYAQAGIGIILEFVGDQVFGVTCNSKT